MGVEFVEVWLCFPNWLHALRHFPFLHLPLATVQILKVLPMGEVAVSSLEVFTLVKGVILRVLLEGPQSSCLEFVQHLFQGQRGLTVVVIQVG